MSETKYDHFFYVLSNKQRLRTLLYLVDNSPASVSTIVKDLQIEQSAVSHALRQLLNCHFVNVNRIGKERIYAINQESVMPIFDLIKKHIKKYCVEECVHQRNNYVKTFT